MIFSCRRLLLACALLPLACSPQTDKAKIRDEAKKAVVQHYAELVFATYSDSLKGALDLDAAIQAFVNKPSEATLQAAKEAWLRSRPPYLQSEVFRFYNGPIDGEGGPEGFINAWPMDESYIDYIKGDPKAGIINAKEKYPEINIALLVSLNEKEGETSISTGYHAIEFLLWGQDLNPDGPGKRPFTDYLPASNPSAARRAAYLQACSQLLVQQLASLVEAWSPHKAGNYREAFVSAPPDGSLSKILLGMGSLSGAELAGERMTVAYESKEQEDEHSCFSDNTFTDHLYDAIGILNVYLGRYQRIDGSVLQGPGIKSLIEPTHPELAKTLENQLTESIVAIKAIPHPFDQAILGEDSAPGRQAIQKAIEALRAQTTSIAEVAQSLGLQINLE